MARENKMKYLVYLIIMLIPLGCWGQVWVTDATEDVVTYIPGISDTVIYDNFPDDNDDFWNGKRILTRRMCRGDSCHYYWDIRLHCHLDFLEDIYSRGDGTAKMLTDMEIDSINRVAQVRAMVDSVEACRVKYVDFPIWGEVAPVIDLDPPLRMKIDTVKVDTVEWRYWDKFIGSWLLTKIPEEEYRYIHRNCCQEKTIGEFKSFRVKYTIDTTYYLTPEQVKIQKTLLSANKMCDFIILEPFNSGWFLHSENFGTDSTIFHIKEDSHKPECSDCHKCKGK